MLLNMLQKLLLNLPRLELPFAIVIVFSYMFLTACGDAELSSEDTGHLFSVTST